MTGTADLPERLVTVHDGHVDIHQHQVRTLRPEKLDGLRAVHRMDEVIIPSKQYLDEFIVTGIVLCDKDPGPQRGAAVFTHHRLCKFKIPGIVSGTASATKLTIF